MTPPPSRRILITGANGVLGDATARHFLERDPECQVHLGVRERRDRAEALVLAFQGRAHLCPLEITRPEGWADAMALIESRGGPVNVLVNNAGFHEDALLANMTFQQWQGVLDANLNAVFHGCQAVLKPMMSQRWGRIVNVASLSALHSPAGQANYAAAKAGINGLTRAMAKEWGRYKVCVNSVAFGLIMTRLTEASARGDAHIDIEGRQIKVGVNPQILESAQKMIPLGRSGTPEEAAGAVYLLCIPESNYVTGQVLVCGGGRP